MTILVTGGAGYIGSQIVYRLADLGHDSVVLDDLSTGFRDAVPDGIPFIVGTTGDRDLVRAIIRQYHVDTIMHLAASTAVAESVHDPIKYYRNNVCATIGLLDACVSENVRRLIFSSSAAIYGNTSGRTVIETAPREPASPYGWSKLMGEVTIESLAAAGRLDFVILRYFNVAGSDPELRTGCRGKNANHLIKVACEVAMGSRPHLPICGSDYPTRDGTCVRDFIHVWDIAELHILSLQHLLRGGPSATLNCGYGRGHSVLEVAESFERVLGKKLPTRVEPRRVGDAPSVISDVTQTTNLLHWVPRFDSVDSIVSSALTWERLLQAKGPAMTRTPEIRGDRKQADVSK